MIVDNTIMSEKKACDLAALVQYVWGKRLPDNNEEILAAGGAIHEGRGAWVRETDPLKRQHITLAKPDDYPTTIQDPTYHFENVAQAFEAWKSRIVTTAQWEWLPEYTEMYVEAPLVDNIMYCALIDTKVQVPRGRAIVECKTRYAVTPWYLKKWRLHGQLSGQWWLMEQTDEKPVCLFVDIIEIPAPKRGATTATRQNRSMIHGPLVRSDAVVAQWKAATIKHAKEFRTMKENHASGMTKEIQMLGVQGDGVLDGHCSFCNLEEWCDKGRPMRWVEEKMVDYDWDPKARALSRQEA